MPFLRLKHLLILLLGESIPLHETRSTSNFSGSFWILFEPSFFVIILTTSLRMEHFWFLFPLRFPVETSPFFLVCRIQMRKTCRFMLHLVTTCCFSSSSSPSSSDFLPEDVPPHCAQDDTEPPLPLWLITCHLFFFGQNVSCGRVIGNFTLAFLHCFKNSRCL